MSDKPAVSVVVPARNAGSALQRLVEALAAQSLGTHLFELIVSDDGSSDGSIEALPTNADWLRVLRGPALTSYAARNRAVSAARAEMLAFIDADCVPERAWLETGIAALTDADIVAGAVRYIVPARITPWTLLDIELHLDQANAVQSGRAATANLFLRRHLLESVGGFDATLPNGGDFDLVARCVARGARLTYCPTAVVWHPARATGRDFLKKVWRINRTTGIRMHRVGRRPQIMKPYHIPVIGMARSRMRRGKSIALDSRRLAEQQVHAPLPQHIVAATILYLLVPYVITTARLRGWWLGKKTGSRAPVE